ncbi:translation initiation factor IF-2, partial [bacterium]|nr:translation initiation factor IF-2 [candidate division CSSED10-310 bacterium]
AKTRQGLGNLLEMVLLNAELLELKANPTAPARGVVLESRLDKGQGSVAAILVQKGTLRIGDPFVIGATYGKVRAMINAQGKRIKEAGPATPVEVLGLCGIAQAGDPFQVVENEREAKVIAETRRESAKERDRINSQKITFEDLFSRIQEGTVKDFNIILKGDVQGACEAVNAALEKLSTDKVKVSVLHSGVGAISENDVMLASSSNATVVGFNVKMEPNVPVVAKREKIQIRNYKVIYELLDDVRKAMEGMLDPIKTEVRMGMAIVRQVFSISRLGTIAGCYVQDGKVERNAVAKVFREDEEIHCGQIGSLKRFKDDVREVGTGFECGIGIDGFDEFAEGDKIEVYRIEETKGCL